MRPLAIRALSAVSAIGRGAAAAFDSLDQRRGGLRPTGFAGIPGWIGAVEGVAAHTLPSSLAAYDCRNNRLADMALNTDGFAARVAEAKARLGSDRIGVIVGTSTSGVLALEDAYRDRDPGDGDLGDGALPQAFDYTRTHDLSSLACYVRAALGLTGPALTVSAACASSARCFVDAVHFIETGVCDAVVVGGADSLCRMTLRGFASLGIVAPGACRPCDADRDGISIGEAAGFALLEPLGPGEAGLALLGTGASSDAHHMSSPHPEALGAALAMRAALADAGLDPSEIDYVNLHGTGTRANDAMEDQAMMAVFGPDVPCGTTKGWTGHTMGSSGILEAALSAACLEHGLIPGCPERRARGPRVQIPCPRRERAPSAASRAEQLLRLRRHQLQLGPGVRAVIRVSILGASVFGPGLAGWTNAAPILSGQHPWAFADQSPPPPALLPANERRRAGLPVRLAMAVSEEAVARSGLPKAAPRGVFASSNGDGAVLNAILRALSAPSGTAEAQVSPTQFHNSVHNAVAANWTIGVGSMRPATCIGMHDDTFAAGLLKAAAETAREREPVLLCAYDAPMPEPLNAKRPTAFAFAAAFVLAPEGGTPLALRYTADAVGPEAWRPRTPGVDGLAEGNAAARSLRLLEALACGAADRFALPLAGGRVEIEV